MLFVRRKFQQNIRFDFERGGDVEQHVQRNGPHHVRRFDGSHVLAADADALSQLFLRQLFALSIIGDRAAEVAVAFRIVKVFFGTAESPEAVDVCAPASLLKTSSSAREPP